MAEVDLREEGTFHRAGFIFKGEKLHGLALFGAHHLAGDEPAREAYFLTGHGQQGAGREGVESFSAPLEEHDGVMGAEKTEDAVLFACPPLVPSGTLWYPLGTVRQKVSAPSSF